jgi:pSer/pThr/pTyr-binding forkhead associated (FHA) protein
MKLSLLVLTTGKQANKLLPISLAQFVIGRDPDCQLRPASPSISKRHCAIIQRDGKVFLRDFDSTNGTFLNGERITGEVELKQDDRIKAGPIELAVKLESTVAERRTPAPASKPAATKAKEPKVVAAAAPAAKKAAPVVVEEKSGTNDEDAAALLLGLGDEDDGDSPPRRVPDGTTVMDMKVPTEVVEAAKGVEGKDAKKDDKNKAKNDTGNTVNAAKNILEKMMRRPR